MKLFSNLLVSILYRKEQLLQQERNDNRLTKLSLECPSTIIEYFMLERKLNRELTYRYENLNPVDIYRITSENIEITKEELIIYNKDVCDCDTLKTYLEGFKMRHFPKPKYQ